MRISNYIIFLVFFVSMSVFAEVNPNKATAVFIEPEIELPAIKIPMPKKQAFQPEIQVEKLKDPAPILEETNKEEHVALPNVKSITNKFPRPL